MTTNEKVARRKLSLLEFTIALNNASKACEFIDYYKIRHNNQTYEISGLLDWLFGCSPYAN